MSVKELIEELQKLPPDMIVMFSLYDGWGGEEEVSSVEIDSRDNTLDSSGNKLSPVVKLY